LYPPGDEIYRDDAHHLSVYEVDGAYDIVCFNYFVTFNIEFVSDILSMFMFIGEIIP
jgi:hypothetical protein